jgi:diguanylate cyclase
MCANAQTAGAQPLKVTLVTSSPLTVPEPGSPALFLVDLPPAGERLPEAVEPAVTVADDVDVDVGDWNDLLDAIKTRLREVVAVHRTEDVGLPPAHIRARVEASVLDCAGALDQLQSTLMHELGRRRAVERELATARCALEQSLADLAGMQAEERQARHRAHHDSLTQLPNGSHFREQLERALALAHLPQAGLAVLYLDLDGFKSINDKHGHDMGDALLCIIASRLRHAVRAGDVVGRLGGDEFACLVMGALDRDQLSHMACKLFDAVSSALQIGEVQLSVNPSIGIASCSAAGQTADALLKAADAAMYRAKRQHSAYAFFDLQHDG